MSVELSIDEVRRIALWSQGLVNNSPGLTRRASESKQRESVRQMLYSLGAVQLDTISVLARSHELVAYARLGAIGRSVIESAYWQDGDSFEYWSHAACILPMDSWPAFTFRRRHYARRGIRWHEVPKAMLEEVRQRLVKDGPLTTREIGGAKRGGEWWDWSESKVAIEYLLDIGEVVCTERVGWRRVYDLAERVVPRNLRSRRGWVDDDGVVGPTDDDCITWLIAEGARTVGVGTAADIADVHRLPTATVHRNADSAGLIPVRVKGWSSATWATAEALAWLERGERIRHRTTMLSPFDSLVWHRGRTERVFGMSHRLEAYTPAPKREHGYFAMPVLHRGHLIARVDPKRDGSTLVADRVTFEVTTDDAIAGVATALLEAASWVNCDAVRLGGVLPGSAKRRLARELATR